MALTRNSSRFATEVRDFRDEKFRQSDVDCVSLLVHNIDELWTDAEFSRLCSRPPLLEYSMMSRLTTRNLLCWFKQFSAAIDGDTGPVFCQSNSRALRVYEQVRVHNLRPP